MSDITDILDTLERRIKLLVEKTDKLEQKLQDMQQQIAVSSREKEQQLAEIAKLQSTCDSLKMANALLGSDDNKKETKLKINSLIREIDYCISQLAS
jgi:hypothetical protein